MAKNEFTAMSRDDEARIFHEGVRLFNNGQWFEAHETWEDIWHIASGEKKRFYQGLIQYAVVIEHIRRGNPRGVKCVYQTCRQKFADLPEVYMGIRIESVYEGLRRMVQPVLAMEAKAFDPATGRGQEMPVDLKTAPVISLEYDPFSIKETWRHPTIRTRI